MSQWVQHISGQGEKWPLEQPASVSSSGFYSRNKSGQAFFLPKPDYILCDPPEVWTDVAHECELKIDMLSRQQIWHGGICVDGAVGYRFKKEQCFHENGLPRHAFIVEKRKS